MPQLNVSALRDRFPALARTHQGSPVIYLDGPGGTQVPQSVIDAVSEYLRAHNANSHGPFPTSQETDDILARCRTAVAALLGADDAATVNFGLNMTTLTFAASRAIGRTLSPGDEVVVTELDHDANVTPWRLAAAEAGATLRTVAMRPEDGTLDLDDLAAKLTERTRVVAVGAASNALGTLNPVAKIAAQAHAVGALVYVDAVHYAPHRAIDMAAWDADLVACSAYKFFGPHVGCLWAKRDVLERLPDYHVSASGGGLGDRFTMGTQSHEAIAGMLAAIDYFAALGAENGAENGTENGTERGTAADAPAGDRRTALVAAYRAIEQWESRLCRRLLEGLAALPAVRVHGLRDPERLHERVSTVSITARGHRPADLARQLAERGIFAWHGHYYAIYTMDALGLTPDGTLRLGLMHYNTEEEVDRLLAALEEILDG